MGQRHQVFAIARIRPRGQSLAKYRCVAAFHHQWCYGSLPLEATHRFLTLIKQRDNADIIRAELRHLDGKYGRWKQKPLPPKVPCPYVAFLLATTWTLDLSDPNEIYASGVSFRKGVLPAYMGSADGDNNDGISVIDITNPAFPAYCFVHLDERIPLSAEDYIRGYYPEPDSSEMADEEVRLHEQTVLEKIAMLQEQRVMTLDMLVEAWPTEYEGSSDSTLPTIATIPTLADLSIGPAVKDALMSGDTTDIENIIWLPAKADAIKRVLQEQSPFPDSGLNLLARIFEQLNDDEVLDLSYFHLSSDQLIKLAMDIKGFKVLNLSYNTSITIQTVRDILSAFPKIRRIVLLGCTSISDADIYHLISTETKLLYHIEAIIHIAFLRFRIEAPYKSAFTYVGLIPDDKLATAFSLPFFTPSTVVQALTDVLGPLAGDNILDISAYVQQSMSAQSALAGLPRNQGPWNQRSVAVLPLTSLKAFDGEGWTFALKRDMFSMGPNPNNFYGFMRFPSVSSEAQPVGGEKDIDEERVVDNPPVPSCELHGLSSFLNEMVLEGRPAPPAQAVDELEKIIRSMEEAGKIRLITQSEVGSFVDTVWRYHIMRSSLKLY